MPITPSDPDYSEIMKQQSEAAKTARKQRKKKERFSRVVNNYGTIRKGSCE